MHLIQRIQLGAKWFKIKVLLLIILHKIKERKRCIPSFGAKEWQDWKIIAQRAARSSREPSKLMLWRFSFFFSFYLFLFSNLPQKPKRVEDPSTQKLRINHWNTNGFGQKEENPSSEDDSEVDRQKTSPRRRRKPRWRNGGANVRERKREKERRLGFWKTER